jgi:hypothetical protein
MADQDKREGNIRRILKARKQYARNYYDRQKLKKWAAKQAAKAAALAKRRLEYGR